ncbi:MAG: glycosyltransferase family 2 protein [Pseudomonadota bacterium]
MVLYDHSGMPAFFAWQAAGEQQNAGEGAGGQPTVSIVAPMHNEAGGAAALIDEISAALGEAAHEIIVVDDASTDETFSVLKAAQERTPQLRIVRHGQNAGQSRALRTGILAARADIVAMLDGDGQNNPADIPLLLSKLSEEADPPSIAMVAGERRARQDAAAKKWASRMANGIRRRLLKDGAVDTGCGLKVFYREAFLRLPFFDHMHRYLPALMRREGFTVAFVPVSHRPRVHGTSKYTNLGRFLVAIRDLTGVLWLLSRSRSPKTITESRD